VLTNQIFFVYQQHELEANVKARYLEMAQKVIEGDNVKSYAYDFEMAQLQNDS